MCFIVAEKREGERQAELSQGHRSIEVKAYHKKLQKVEILFLVYFENKYENNTLLFLHPGNVSCEPADLSKGLPSHQDEKRVQVKNGTNVLKSIYDRVFDYDEKEKKFHLRKILTPWDSLCDIDEQKEIAVWNNLSDKFIEPLFSVENKTKWIPFSACKLGPFPDKRDYILAVNTTLSEGSYAELIKSDSFFTIDGPKQLLNNIKHIFIPYLPEAEQKNWRERFLRFKNCLCFDESYDMVILDQPYADKVIADMSSSSLITEGPLKPITKKPFKRYITASSAFKLKLSYADSCLEEAEEFSFVEEKATVS